MEEIMMAEQMAAEAADNFTENRDILRALEENGFTRSDLAEGLGITDEELDADLHRNLSYNSEKSYIMDTIERMAAWKKEHRFLSKASPRQCGQGTAGDYPKPTTIYRAFLFYHENARKERKIFMENTTEIITAPDFDYEGITAGLYSDYLEATPGTSNLESKLDGFSYGMDILVERQSVSTEALGILEEMSRHCGFVAGFKAAVELIRATYPDEVNQVLENFVII